MNKAPRYVFLFVILYGIIFVFGYIANIKGVVYPLINTEFGLSDEQQGMMVSLLGMGNVLFSFIGGILIGSIGVKKTFIAGFLFVFTGLVTVFFVSRFLSVAGALFIMFAGFGFFHVSSNALAAQLFKVRTALLMTLLHFSFGLGSIISPRVAGTLAANLSWRYAYLFSIPLVLLLFVPALFTRFPGSTQENPSAKKISFFTALKTPEVWVFSVVLGLMMVVEISSINWAGLYFQNVYGLDPKTSGAAFLSNFFILFTLSRLLSGFVIDKIGYVRCLFIAALASIFTLTLGFGMGERGIYILPALGFFTAVFFPITMVTAMGYFREDAPVMISAVIVIAGALNSGMQLLIGVINSLAGPAWGYRSVLVYAVLVAAALLVLRRYMRRPYKDLPVEQEEKGVRTQEV